MPNRSPGIYQRKNARGVTVWDAVANVSGVQRWSRGHRTKAEAEQAREELRTALRSGMSTAPARLTLAAYLLDRWLPYKVAELSSDESRRNYKHWCARIVEDLGQAKLQKLRPLDIEAFKLQLRASGLSGTSANHGFRILKASLRQAVKWRLIPFNPCDAVDAPKRQAYNPPTLDDQTIRAVLAAADATPYGALIYTAVTTGLRWSELAALRWASVDMAIGVAYVRHSKTAKGVRAVALGPATVERLQAHRLEQMRYFRERGAPPPVLVFLSVEGKGLNQGNFNVGWWQPIRKAAGVPTLRFHDLRHIQATLLARATTWLTQ